MVKKLIRLMSSLATCKFHNEDRKSYKITKTASNASFYSIQMEIAAISKTLDFTLMTKGLQMRIPGIVMKCDKLASYHRTH